MLAPSECGKWHALIDGNCAHLLAHTWKAIQHPTTGLVYFRRWVKSRRRYVSLHREVWEHNNGPVPIGHDIDHADGNTLNCRWTNLRACTRSQNCANHKRRRDASSIFKGVMPRKNNKWTARICVNGVRKNLGTFDSDLLAAVAYDNAAIQYFGEFAKTNFQRSSPCPAP